MHIILPCGFIPGEEAFLIRLLAVWWLIVRCHDSIHGEAVVGGEGDVVELEVSILTAAETITIIAPVRGKRGWGGGGGGDRGEERREGVRAVGGAREGYSCEKGGVVSQTPLTLLRGSFQTVSTGYQSSRTKGPLHTQSSYCT